MFKSRSSRRGLSAPHRALYAYRTKRQQVVGKELIRDSRFVSVDFSHNISLRCAVLYHISDVASMANVVDSDFPMYQIRNFQCSRLAKPDVVDSRFPMYQIRTLQRGNIRQRKATQDENYVALRCLYRTNAENERSAA